MAGPATPASPPPATLTSRSNLAAAWGDAALRLPAIYLVFGLAKRWLLGTHHGAVSKKHLPAYLDEYVFRFNRRTRQEHQSPLRPLHPASRPDPPHHLSRPRRCWPYLRLMESSLP